jgi:hypothetical protein
MNDLLNALPSERFLSESPLDVIENFCMCWFSLVQNIPKLKIRRAEAVAKVLSKDPSAVCNKKKNVK